MASASEVTTIIYPSDRDWHGLTEITLHLYRASGEFVCEHRVLVVMGIHAFTSLLEEGMVAREFNLEQNVPCPSFMNRYAGQLHRERPCEYTLVWEGMVMEHGTTFSEYIDNHGMSLASPNDICVLQTEVQFVCFEWQDKKPVSRTVQV